MRASKVFKDIGRKIRVFRKSMKWSQIQTELPRGTYTDTISRIKNGDVNPTITSL